MDQFCNGKDCCCSIWTQRAKDAVALISDTVSPVWCLKQVDVIHFISSYVGDPLHYITQNGFFIVVFQMSQKPH